MPETSPTPYVDKINRSKNGVVSSISVPTIYIFGTNFLAYQSTY